MIAHEEKHAVVGLPLEIGRRSLPAIDVPEARRQTGVETLAQVRVGHVVQW